MSVSVAVRPPDKNSGPDVCPLFLDCTDEPLSAAQTAAYNKKSQDFIDQMKKLEALAKTSNSTVTLGADGASATIVNTTTERLGTTTRVTPAAPSVTSTPSPSNLTPVQALPAAQNTNVRLLMDPRTGRILGSIPAQQQQQQQQPTQQQPRPLVAAPTNLVPVSPPVGRGGVNITPASRSVVAKRTTQPAPPTVDLTRNTSVAGAGGGRTTLGLSTNRQGGHRFPCLQVQPKAQKMGTNLAARKTELDNKVKQLLVMTPAKFTEWLMQQGMILQEQWEFLPNGSKLKLKLAMHSDGKRFANSGGYVWVNERNTGKFTSVFRGSLFDSNISTPTVFLKLIYHWVCQTNIDNVQTWVKVSQNVVDAHYRHLRSIAIASVQEDLVNLGGPGKVVEIGVISLGTTSADGSRKEVRVEVLGVMDRNTGKIRLRATEPNRNGRPMSQSERFTQIFKPLPVWVNLASKIVIDSTVDKDKVRQFGFNSIIQTSNRGRLNDPNSNSRVMDYLKKVVPKMFQNSLSSLSTSQIQEFLDELSFREAFGYYPLLGFNSCVQKIAFQTTLAASISKFGKNGTLLERLAGINRAPFADWRSKSTGQDDPSGPSYGIDALPPSLRTVDTQFTVNTPRAAGGGSAAKRAMQTAAANAPMIKKPKEMVSLESYYYSTLAGDSGVLSGEFKADMAFKCHLCKKVYMNNIEFARHLSLHVESDRASAVDLVDLCQCKYCFKDFDTPFAMQTHLEEIHWKKGFDCVCRICEEGFKTKGTFMQHMTVVHAKYEMPYSCAVCAFRSSFHKDVVDHFQEAHDRSDKLQCPRCLKTFSLFSNNQYNANVASSYVTHLQAHIDRKVTCKKCCLTFHTDKEMKAHLDKDHVSFSTIKNVEPYEYQSGEEPTQIPKPDERGWKQASRGGSSLGGAPRAAQQQAAFAAQNLDDVAMYEVEGSEDCGECGRKLINKQHFAAYLCCTKCRYSTCCSRAMSLHISIFHGTKSKPEFDLGQPVILNQEMYCCCGFYAKSGNKMAKHLSLNNCRTAYPTMASAKSAVQTLSSASFAPLVSLEDERGSGGPNVRADDVVSFDPSVVMAQAYQKDKRDKAEQQQTPPLGQQGPLAFLGLQRRPSAEETTDKEDSNKATAESSANQSGTEDENKSDEPMDEDNVSQ